MDASRAASQRRRRTRAVRRRRLVAVTALLVLGAAALAIGRSGVFDGGRSRNAGAPAERAPRQGSRQPELVAKPLRALPAPISGEVVVARGARLVIAGGLDGAGRSAGGVFSLDPASGALSSAGTLAQPVHDAAGARLKGRTLVVGGGTSTAGDAVERIGGRAGARIISRLPAPRADLVAASVGGRVYVIGGSGGEAPAAAVLATRDGRSFSTVARLRVPVRYPACASAHGRIYLFGGESASGQPTDAIQAIDPSTGRVRVVGHLPEPTAHASALGLHGQVYVLGGTTGGKASARILAFEPGRGRMISAGHLPTPVTNAAAASLGGRGYLVGGIGRGGAALRSVIAVERMPVGAHAAANPPGAPSTAGSAPSRAPFRGRLLIADRGNNRLLVVNARKRVLWRYPGSRPKPKGGFYFPDDAFFIDHGRGIISNEEENETIVELGYPSGRTLRSFGHPGVIGSSRGYFHEPDDAYLLRDGTITVADAQNCRVLFLGPTGRASQIGTTGSCVHDPPRSLADPNGDTPLANGDVLVSEVEGSYVDELTRRGRLLWSVHLPIAYPSDPQRLGPDRYLVADYTRPGGVYEFSRAGRILWSYHPASGRSMLDHPSLAERFPGGLIAVTDDYRDRVALIDRRTKRIVWQYGRPDRPGTGPNRLRTPDGFDLLAPSGRFPTHPYTG